MIQRIVKYLSYKGMMPRYFGEESSNPPINNTVLSEVLQQPDLYAPMQNKHNCRHIELTKMLECGHFQCVDNNSCYTVYSPVMLNGSGSWTLNQDLKKQILAFENNCYRRLLKRHVTPHVRTAWRYILELQGTLGSMTGCWRLSRRTSSEGLDMW